MDFCYSPLPIGAVQGPQPRRWWLLTMATGAQCGVWNRPQMLESTPEKQNQTKYMDFVINHGPWQLYKVLSLDDDGFIPWPQGPSVVFEIDPQRLHRRRTNKTSLNTWVFVKNHCLWRRYKVPSLDDGVFIPWPLGSSVVFEIDPQRLNRRRTNKTSLNTWVFVKYHCLWLWYKVPSLDDGPVWCLKSTPSAWIDVGQTKLTSIHGFLL